MIIFIGHTLIFYFTEPYYDDNIFIGHTLIFYFTEPYNDNNIY